MKYAWRASFPSLVMCVVSEAGGETASTVPDTSAAAEDDCNITDKDDFDAIIFLE